MPVGRAGNSIKLPHSGNCDVDAILMLADAAFIIFPIWRSLISLITFSRFLSSRSRRCLIFRRCKSSSVEKIEKG